MKVCFATQAYVRYSDDAVGSFVFRLAEGVAARGESVTVVAPHAPGLAVTEHIGRTNVVRFRYAPAPYERIAYRGAMHTLVKGNLLNKALAASLLAGLTVATTRTVLQQKSEVIHAHWWFPGGVAGAIASRLTGVPLVITSHGTDVSLLGRNALVDRVAAMVFRRAAAVTVVSHDLRDRLVERLPDLAGRVAVIPMPVHSVFTRNGRSEVRPATQAPTILAVGRLAAQKGFDTLIAAVALLRARGSAAVVQLAGGGDEEASLRDLAARLGMVDAVRFLGVKTAAELAGYYRTCDVAVLPSHNEGLGLALVEAMFSGAPVVGSRSGGIRDLIKDGETGLLTAPGDANALADALARLLSDQAYARRLGRAGQAYVREHFAPAASVAGMMAVYRQAAIEDRAESAEY